jgi:hypothetical protein
MTKMAESSHESYGPKGAVLSVVTTTMMMMMMQCDRQFTRSAISFALGLNLQSVSICKN